MKTREYWTEEEIRILVEYYSDHSIEEMMRLLPNHPKYSIINKASDFKLGRSKWSFDEIDTLKDLFNEGCSDEVIGQKIDRTANSVRQQRLKLGLKKQLAGRWLLWTDDELTILRGNYAADWDTLAKLLPRRSRHSILHKTNELGLGKINHWTNEQEEFIKQNWSKMSDEELAESVGHSLFSTAVKRRSMGLTHLKTPSYNKIGKYLRANQSGWRRKSVELNSGKCILTGADKYEVHHLMGISTIMIPLLEEMSIEGRDLGELSEKEREILVERFQKEIDKYPLGVCLRPDVHYLFHKIYGKKNNTPEQFYEFQEDFKKGKYNKLLNNN